MGNIRTDESVLAADRTLAVGVQNCPSEECEPVTLQVVLLGSDGIVIASDTCMESHRSERNFRITDSVSKIVVTPKLVYTFAGDDCAKEIGAAVVKEAAGTQKPLSPDFIDEASMRALKVYKETVGNDFSDTSRKIIWIQTEGAGFAIWSARYEGGRFVPCIHPVECDGKCRVFAGDESNQARFVVEYYYDKYPLRRISSLKRLAAHAILTGSTFNSAGVSGLEMVVGNNGRFTRVPREEIQKLVKLSRTIHEENDSRFRGQNSRPYPRFQP